MTSEPLVLLPGTLCDARVFAPVLARLPGTDARMPVLDGAGTPAAGTPDAMAEELLATLPPRFALGGFSLGGIVALAVMARAPERVTRLALLNTTARPDEPERSVERRNAVRRAGAIGLDRHVVDALWPVYVADDGLADETNRALVRAMAVEAGLETLRFQTDIAVSRPDRRPGLAAIAVPTLVLCGEHDRLCPPDLHREMAAAIPDSRLVIVPGTGHFPLIERPDSVADALRDWLVAPARVSEDP